MITKFEVINPVPIRTKPFYNKRGNLVIPNIATAGYKWYLEAARNNPRIGDREYFLLFSDTKFDNSCVRIIKDYVGRPCINPSGEFAKFIDREINARANVDIEYLYSEDNLYDVWQVR